MFETLPRRTQLLARVLHHPVRAALKAHIHTGPEPVALADLSRVFGLAGALVSYHVRVLAACGLVELDRDGLACRRT